MPQASAQRARSTPDQQFGLTSESRLTSPVPISPDVMAGAYAARASAKPSPAMEASDKARTGPLGTHQRQQIEGSTALRKRYVDGETQTEPDMRGGALALPEEATRAPGVDAQTQVSPPDLLQGAPESAGDVAPLDADREPQQRLVDRPKPRRSSRCQQRPVPAVPQDTGKEAANAKNQLVPIVAQDTNDDETNAKQVFERTFKFSLGGPKIRCSEILESLNGQGCNFPHAKRMNRFIEKTYATRIATGVLKRSRTLAGKTWTGLAWREAAR